MKKPMTRPRTTLPPLNKVVSAGMAFISIIGFASARQSFDEHPRYSEVNPGEDLVLTCRIFEKSRNSQCIWQKDGKPIRLQDRKYEWSGSQDSGDCSLRIINADINYDDGRFRI